MKKTTLYFITLFSICLVWSIPANNGFALTEDTFPPLEGWEKGQVDTYLPHNLFEYINGAAEVYLGYDFQKLVTVTYENENRSITVDIYQHSNPSTGFGIYSQEKPLEGNFLEIGTQGYHETGVLNFFKGPYYVKLTAFDLGEKDRFWLEKTARLLDNKLDGKPVFPEIISCFPERGKIKNSERYIFTNYLGHSFLNSAFVADYRPEERKFQIFIIQAGSTAEAETMVKSYLDFLQSKNVKYRIDDQKIYRFQDPYYRSSGTMGFRRQNNIIWGFFYDDENLFQSYMEDIQQNLRARGLIQ